MPINLLETGDCPGGPWCLSKCSNASPSMWDMPSLLAIDGCNTYTAQRAEAGLIGGQVKIVAAVTEQRSIRRYLEGVGLPPH